MYRRIIITFNELSDIEAIKKKVGELIEKWESSDRDKNAQVIWNDRDPNEVKYIITLKGTGAQYVAKQINTVGKQYKAQRIHVRTAPKLKPMGEHSFTKNVHDVLTLPQVRKVLISMGKELNYLFDKDPEVWDEYDKANWKSILRKYKQINTELDEDIDLAEYIEKTTLSEIKKKFIKRLMREHKITRNKVYKIIVNNLPLTEVTIKTSSDNLDKVKDKVDDDDKIEVVDEVDSEEVKGEVPYKDTKYSVYGLPDDLIVLLKDLYLTPFEEYINDVLYPSSFPPSVQLKLTNGKSIYFIYKDGVWTLKAGGETVTIMNNIDLAQAQAVLKSFNSRPEINPNPEDGEGSGGDNSGGSSGGSGGGSDDFEDFDTGDDEGGEEEETDDEA